MAGKKEKKPSVIIYTTTWCPWCKKVKEFLSANKIAFEERDVENDRKWADEMIKKSGQTGTPVLDIKGTVIVGFDEPEIRKALGLLPSQ